MAAAAAGVAGVVGVAGPAGATGTVPAAGSPPTGTLADATRAPALQTTLQLPPPAVPSASGAQLATPATSNPAPLKENYVPRLEKVGLWAEIMRLLNQIADHASSLIHNVTNNMCEVANSVTAGFLAGKRIFYSGRNSFNIRCSAATLQLNSSGQFQRRVHKKMQGASPGKLPLTCTYVHPWLN